MNADAIKEKMEKYYATATPEQILKEFEDLGVEFVKSEGPVEILTKYGAIPTDWRHCIQELEKYYEYNLEEQKRQTALAMFCLFKILIHNQSDVNWKKGLLQTITKYENELHTKA